MMDQDFQFTAKAPSRFHRPTTASVVSSRMDVENEEMVWHVPQHTTKEVVYVNPTVDDGKMNFAKSFGAVLNSCSSPKTMEELENEDFEVGDCDVELKQNPTVDGEDMSLTKSFEFIMTSLSSSKTTEEIEKEDCSKDVEVGDPDSLDAAQKLKQIYTTMVNEIKILLSPALVPVVHLQVPSRVFSKVNMEKKGKNISTDSVSTCASSIDGQGVSKWPTSNKSMEGDDECRFENSPPRREVSLASFKQRMTTQPLAFKVVMREDIPEDSDGREVIITRSPTSKAKRCSFVAEFYRSEVTPLLE